MGEKAGGAQTTKNRLWGGGGVWILSGTSDIGCVAILKLKLFGHFLLAANKHVK